MPRRSSHGSPSTPIARPHAIAISIEKSKIQWKSRPHAAVRWDWRCCHSANGASHHLRSPQAAPSTTSTPSPLTAVSKPSIRISFAIPVQSFQLGFLIRDGICMIWVVKVQSLLFVTKCNHRIARYGAFFMGMKSPPAPRRLPQVADSHEDRRLGHFDRADSESELRFQIWSKRSVYNRFFCN